MYREVVKAWSDCNKYYLCWFRNIVSGDSAGSNRIEKDRICVTPGLVLGEWGEGVVWFSVCEMPLGNWANGGSITFFHTWWVWF